MQSLEFLIILFAFVGNKLNHESTVKRSKLKRAKEEKQDNR